MGLEGSRFNRYVSNYKPFSSAVWLASNIPFQLYNRHVFSDIFFTSNKLVKDIFSKGNPRAAVTSYVLWHLPGHQVDLSHHHNLCIVRLHWYISAPLSLQFGIGYTVGRTEQADDRKYSNTSSFTRFARFSYCPPISLCQQSCACSSSTVQRSS